jgi:glucose-1-phosphate thymidylyltransferase
MRAVVLAGGRGTRLRRPSAAARLTAAQAEAADRGLKALVPVGGRPFLDYGLSRLADAGVAEVVVVIGPSSEPIREHYRAAPPSRIRLAFALQREPRGSADAVLAAESLLGGGSEFLVANSDDVYPRSALRGLAELGRPGLPVFSGATLLALGNFPRERLAGFATLEVGEEADLRRIVEKPGDGGAAALDDAWYSMNLWRFSPAIFEACRRVPLSARGEKELPQAVGFGIAELGLSFRTFPCADGVLDLSTRDDVEGLEARLSGETPRP